MDAGHASHVAPSFTCTLCQQEAYDAWKVRKAAWDAECAAWTPYKPAGKYDSLIGCLAFPFLLLGGVILFVGFYVPGILLAFRPLAGIGLGWVDPSGALFWLIVGSICVVVIGLAVEDREMPRPRYPKMGPLASAAYYREHPASRPADPRVEPLDQHLDRINAMWPYSAPRGAPPIMPPPVRRLRRPTAREREVIDGWNLPERQPAEPDDLPF